MLLTLCYVVLRRVLPLAALRFRSNDLKELEIVVRRHELAILQRTGRPAMTWTDRLFLTAASRLLPCTLAVLHHHTGDAASLASTLGGEALDLRASSWAPADSP